MFQGDNRVILFALRLDGGVVTSRSDCQFASECNWEVVRQDDNGNIFTIDKFVEQAHANVCTKWWEKLFKDHKQTCFIRRISKS